MRSLKRAFGVCLITLLIAAAGTTIAAAQTKTQLLVYSSFSPEELALLEQAFERAHPEIDLVIMRDSEGIVVARVLAEKDNRQADMLHAISAPVLIRLAEQGMIEPYSPEGVERLEARFVDSHNPPYWVGFGVYSSLVCFNTTEAKAKGLPEPHAWADLVAPVYAGQILMPNPTSSDIGFIAVAAWIRLMGEDKAWQFMDALDKNVAQYLKSGGKVGASVAAGEYPLGITYDTGAAREKAKGAPIEVLLMAEGVGWNVNATAILEGSAKLEAAKAFADYSASEEAMRIYARNSLTVALPGIVGDHPGLPAGLSKALIVNDFAWMAANRERILAEWTRRYGSRAK